MATDPTYKPDMSFDRRGRGGLRQGAGRRRTESLDAAELRFLASLVEHSDGQLKETVLVAKLRRIADRVATTGR